MATPQTPPGTTITTTTTATTPPPDPPQRATNPWISLFGIYLIILNLVLIYLILRIWPGKIPMSNGPDLVTIIPGLPPLSLWPEARYLALVFLMGALGAYIHLATSFTEFLGNRNFYTSWKWWYGLRPFIGSALALMVYFAARGGLISANSSATDLSPYGIAALAGLAGMFSKQATDKLREVFENLFKTTNPPTRLDSKPPAHTQTDATPPPPATGNGAA
jgi:hypothetical protein